MPMFISLSSWEASSEAAFQVLSSCSSGPAPSSAARDRARFGAPCPWRTCGFRAEQPWQCSLAVPRSTLLALPFMDLKSIRELRDLQPVCPTECPAIRQAIQPDENGSRDRIDKQGAPGQDQHGQQKQAEKKPGHRYLLSCS